MLMLSPFFQKENINKKNLMPKLRKSLSFISRLSSLTLKLRDKPKPLDYISLGITAFDIVVSISEEISKENDKSLMLFFENEKWERLSYDVSLFIKNFIENEEVAKESKRNNQKLILANIGEGVIGYIQEENNRICFHAEKESKEKLFKRINEIIWNNENFLIFEKLDKLSEDVDLKISNVKKTTFINYLQERVIKFLEAKINRSYLLIGNPGTGKSCAIKYICKNLNLKSLRVKISSFCSHQEATFFNFHAFEFLLNICKPDVLIIDDIDRIVNQDMLLYTMEFAKNFCKIVFSTANNRQKVNPALKRPGRFDDILNISEIEESLIKEMIGEECDKEIIEKLKKWPIVYILDFANRQNVLGTKNATNEIKQLEERVREVGCG